QWVQTKVAHGQGSGVTLSRGAAPPPRPPPAAGAPPPPPGGGGPGAPAAYFGEPPYAAHRAHCHPGAA
ncbi:hypothetical protein PVA98_30680, partial [Achromobacter xylosoxidans]|nr:hypothetical protein [Achromobacter xylosoxidans]